LAQRNVLVVGASGVIGQAALRHFAAQPDTRVLGVSRRRPVGVDAPWMPLDLRDGEGCRAVLGALTDVTHVV
jgi:NAD(P)-dependent dehydrogenase (short-subunit alcohol dehydrogenase family)